MKAERFSTSIAFIPWNFNRSHRQAAELFAHHRGNYSLCVHGCDHTSGEFGSTDFTFLREKAQQALNRMKSHQGLSGVDFSRVMVFPQGIFSKAALQALKACNYLAAVNSTPYPVDEVDALTLKDLLQVTITRYGDFPLFTRRYPIEEAEQAFDLFLGKPALIVEHHSFFRNGYAALAETVRRLYKLDHRLRWADLDSICSQTCLKKVSERGEVHLLFFADRFCFQNDTNSRQSYVLIRRSRADQPARDVLINRQSVEFTEEKGWIRMTLILQPGQSAEARIDYEATNAAASTSSRRDPVYQVRVFLRRRLSEFRDNYLDKFRGLSRSARAVLRATQ